MTNTITGEDLIRQIASLRDKVSPNAARTLKLELFSKSIESLMVHADPSEIRDGWMNRALDVLQALERDVDAGGKRVDKAVQRRYSLYLRQLLRFLREEYRLVPKQHYLEQYTVLGIVLGFALGIPYGNPAMGMALGITFGAAVGANFDSRAHRDNRIINPVKKRL